MRWKHCSGSQLRSGPGASARTVTFTGPAMERREQHGARARLRSTKHCVPGWSGCSRLVGALRPQRTPPARSAGRNTDT